MELIDFPKYLTPPSFSQFSGIPLRTVRDLMKSGKLRGFKSGKVTYILAESYKELAFPEFPSFTSEIEKKQFAEYMERKEQTNNGMD